MAWTYRAGTSGTVTLPAGARLLAIRCESHSNIGAVAIFGGDSILVNGDAGAGQHMVLQFDTSSGPEAMAPASNRTVVFTNTASYFVAYSTAPGT